jgi:hypothetical protein
MATNVPAGNDAPRSKHRAVLAREKRTLHAMLDIYCRARHGSAGRLCAECAALEDYAIHRLDRCPFGADKTTCAKCPIHCYQPAMRAKIQAVMRYAGPRMLYRHPILALFHPLAALRGRLHARKST